MKVIIKKEMQAAEAKKWRAHASEDRIDAIIGNVRLKCHECEDDVEVVCELGEAPDYESATARICLRCLEKAVELLKG